MDALRLISLGFALSLVPLHPAIASYVPAGEYPMAGKYIGVLVCDDCAGIWTELTLDDPGPDTGLGSGTFVMTERFTGGAHGGATITTRGEWSTVKWVKEEPFTGTLELRKDGHEGGPPAPVRFYCDHGRSLRLVDALGNSLVRLEPATDGVTLERVIPPPRAEFGPLTEADNHSEIMGRVGDIFVIKLPARSGTDTLNAWTTKLLTSKCIALESVTGFGNGDVFSSALRLKAVTPGKARVEFQNAENPLRTVDFSFQIAP